MKTSLALRQQCANSAAGGLRILALVLFFLVVGLPSVMAQQSHPIFF
jgi:hypothetical protein